MFQALWSFLSKDAGLRAGFSQGRADVCGRSPPSPHLTRPLPQQLGCVIETFQREICFSSLNFKQNFKCQVSKAKWGY